MILRLDHVGFATDDSTRLSALMRTLGLTEGATGTADEYGVACAFWATAADRTCTAIELVSPTRADSAIAGQLTGGGGLYHVALEVDDLAGEQARLRRAGLVPVDRTPCNGARAGMRVAFLYAPRPADLLVELVAYTAPIPTAVPAPTEEKAP